MVTYTNNADEEVIWIPSEFKINVSMENIGDYHMEDLDFTCTFYTNPCKKVIVEKSDMIAVDADNYVAALSSLDLGEGTLTVEYDTEIPDDDFPDGLRHEVGVIKTKLKLM